MCMLFYNIPFFSSSFYLFLIGFFSFSSISRNETKREDENISITLVSLQDIHRWRRWPIYFPRKNLIMSALKTAIND